MAAKNIIVIGASAGGVDALKNLFWGLPENCRLRYSKSGTSHLLNPQSGNGQSVNPGKEKSQVNK